MLWSSVDGQCWMQLLGSAACLESLERRPALVLGKAATQAAEESALGSPVHLEVRVLLACMSHVPEPQDTKPCPGSLAVSAIP